MCTQKCFIYPGSANYRLPDSLKSFFKDTPRAGVNARLTIMETTPFGMFAPTRLAPPSRHKARQGASLPLPIIRSAFFVIFAHLTAIFLLALPIGTI